MVDMAKSVPVSEVIAYLRGLGQMRLDTTERISPVPLPKGRTSGLCHVCGRYDEWGVTDPCVCSHNDAVAWLEKATATEVGNGNGVWSSKSVGEEE